jgi:hypothetical protein
MKSLLVIAALALGSVSFAADSAAPAAAAPAPATAPAPAMAKKGSVSKEARTKCKAEHKGDKKGYMECLKAAK